MRVTHAGLDTEMRQVRVLPGQTTEIRFELAHHSDAGNTRTARRGAGPVSRVLSRLGL